MMKRIKYNDFLKKPNVLPLSAGFFAFYSGEQALFVKSTENLRRFVSLYCDKDNEDAGIKELVKQIDCIEYFANDVLIESLIEEILFIQKHEPPFNKIITPWYKYIYLGINIENPPYFKVCDDTIRDFLYLGPFRSAFALNDILDVFAELFKMPRCSCEIGDKINGCERLYERLCLGFCQNKLGEVLPEMINKMMMLPNKELIDKLNFEYEALLNDLEFQKADTLKGQISLLKRYYKHILFFYTSQFIEGKFKVGKHELTIKDGMICEVGQAVCHSVQSVCHSGRMTVQSEKKKNELLAYEKSEFDHRWIVFSFLYDTQPQFIEKIFMENVVELQKDIFQNCVSFGTNDSTIEMNDGTIRRQDERKEDSDTRHRR